MDQHKTEARNLLAYLREVASAAGYHDASAHLSLAYHAEEPPLGREVIAAAKAVGLSPTPFFTRNQAAIEAQLEQVIDWRFLEVYAKERLALEPLLTRSEIANSGYGRNIQYFDPRTGQWVQTKMKAIAWFDHRDLMRCWQTQTRDDLRQKAYKELERLLRLRDEKPAPWIDGKIQRQEFYIKRTLPNRLKNLAREKNKQQDYLAKVETLKDFKADMLSEIRAVENNLRQLYGVPAIGEGWVSEIELLHRVRSLYPTIEVIHHGRPVWLGRQHFDIWLPALSVAIEYHGVQHFEPVERFGGNTKFLQTQQRDARKRELCSKHAVRLIEVAYDQNISDSELVALIGATSPAST